MKLAGFKDLYSRKEILFVPCWEKERNKCLTPASRPEQPSQPKDYANVEDEGQHASFLI